MPDDDLQITVTNETSTAKLVLIFQQAPDLGQLFINLFPTAWQLLELPPKVHPHDTGGQGTVILPGRTDLGGGPESQAFTRRVSVAERVNPGEKWELIRGRAGSYELNLLETLEEDTVVCANRTGTYASLSLLKNSLPLLTYPRVPQNAAAVFKLQDAISDVIYLAWCEGIAEGEAVRAAVGGPQAVAVPIAGMRTLDAVLRQHDVTGELSWKITIRA